MARSTGLGDVVDGNKPGRASADERIVFGACGMAVFDIGWGFEFRRNALRRGIGRSLNLWKTAAPS